MVIMLGYYTIAATLNVKITLNVKKINIKGYRLTLNVKTFYIKG